ncbi:MAG: hypothetical protein HYV00_12280 [Deltaproteobacteria bacterium]|nr:hypothetical protein [Deltaproteobacteria bacterium]
MNKSSEQGEVLIEKVKGVGGIVLGVSDNRNWIALFNEGDLIHTKTVHLPADTLFDVFVEEIPHKTTVYEHPRTMIYFTGPCDIEICRDGDKIIVRGCQPEEG